MDFSLRTSIVISAGILLAIFGVFVVAARNAAAPDTTPPARIQAPQATTTPESTAPTKTEASTTAEKPATPEKPKETPPAKVPQTPPITTPTLPVTVTIPTTTPEIQIPTSTPSLNDTVRGAVVNILCLSEAGSPVHSISASGVFIDSRGVILTNSHVAQYFLLKDYPEPGAVECVIRTGSPATSKYTAELLFAPPSWIRENAQKIDDAAPTGNGEHDYALLRVTGTVKPEIPMPASFPALSFSNDAPATGESMLVAAYPAGFLGTLAIEQNLYETSSIANIGTLYTFETSTPDLFSVGGTVVSQQGSSGGAAANQEGLLEGLIVTATDAPDTASRDLRALASTYIKTDFQKEAGVSLDAYLSGNLAIQARQFQIGTAPTLTQELVNVLQADLPH